MPIVWILIGLVSLVFFVFDALVWLFTFWWDKRLWLLHRYSIVWALCYIWVNPFWKIDIQGEENIKKGRPYIIVSNHQSALDIVLLYRLWMHFKWVARKEIFWIPVVGWNLWLNKHIAIDRASVSSARKMIVKAQEHLKMGSSVLIFPEGTRSMDGAIKRFKDGAFVLAKKTKYPILPVVLEGSMQVFPRKGYVIKGRQTFKLRILPEISPETFQNKGIGELAKEVQVAITNAHKDIAPEHYRIQND
ncbi:MAG: lysophospholipid acyltransferase family protein [Bacteroidales bacterium]